MENKMKTFISVTQPQKLLTNNQTFICSPTHLSLPDIIFEVNHTEHTIYGDFLKFYPCTQQEYRWLITLLEGKGTVGKELMCWDYNIREYQCE
jgi:hypothetical protein